MPEAPSVKGAEPGHRDGKLPAPRHLLADISEQVVIGQGKAAHLFSQLQSPLGIERKNSISKASSEIPGPSAGGRVGRGAGIGVQTSSQVPEGTTTSISL